MSDRFNVDLNHVRQFIMRRWLVIHALVLSLTILLYETVIAALLSGYRLPVVPDAVVRIENSTRWKCAMACRQVTTMTCHHYQFCPTSSLCLLYANNQTADGQLLLTTGSSAGPLVTCNDSDKTQSQLALTVSKRPIGKESLLVNVDHSENDAPRPQRRTRNAYNQGLEENVDKLWHDLAKFETEKETIKEFEKLVVAELKTKTKEIRALEAAKAQQREEILGLKDVIANLLTENSQINQNIEDVKTEQVNQQHQISGLEFSDQKLTAGMGKLIVQTQELASNVGTLNDASTDAKQRIDDLEVLTHTLHANVETLIEQQKVVHDLVEKVALLAERTTVMSDRLRALQEHQVVAEKEMVDLQATMGRLVASMKAVDESQMRVSGHMNQLEKNVSDHDILMKELLVTQTRDGRKLRKDMSELITKSTKQTQAFDELKAQTSQTSGRFNALTESIAKVSQRNDHLRDSLEHLALTSRKATEEFQRRTSMQAGDIKRLSLAQQSLTGQLSKLGNDEVVLASDLKQFPVMLDRLKGEFGAVSMQAQRLDSQLNDLRSETEALKISISNLQVKQSIKPVVLSMTDPEKEKSIRAREMDDETQLLRLRNLQQRNHGPPLKAKRRAENVDRQVAVHERVTPRDAAQVVVGTTGYVSNRKSDNFSNDSFVNYEPPNSQVTKNGMKSLPNDKKKIHSRHKRKLASRSSFRDLGWNVVRSLTTRKRRVSSMGNH